MKLESSKRIIAALGDLGVIAVAPFAALWMRLGGVFNLNTGLTVYAIMFFVGGSACYLLLRLQRGSWRYVSIEEIVSILKCATGATLAGVFGVLAYGDLEGIPRSILPLSFTVLVAMMAGPRLAYRLVKERVIAAPLFGHRKHGDPCLVYGFSDIAANFIRQSRRQTHGEIYPVGIIAHRDRHQGRALYDVPVQGMLDDLPAVVEQAKSRGLTVSKLILALPKLTPEEIATVVDAASRAGLKTMRLPDFADFLDTETAPAIKLQPIIIDDLLGRAPVELDMSSIGRLFEGKRVLISGAGGSIGSEICRQVGAFNPSHITLLDNGEYNLYMIDGDIAQRFPNISRSTIICDVRERAHVERVLKAEKPDVVFHAAALKHVPLVEMNALEAMKTNVLGTRNIADAALAAGASAFVMISTDKAVNPTSIMGASKRFAEAYCQSLDYVSAQTRFMTVRFGNVLGSAGSVVPLFTRQIAAGGPVTVTHPEIERFFMTIPEAVRLVIAASARGFVTTADRGRIFVLDMGKPMRIVDLARKMIQLSGMQPDIDIKIEFIGLRPAEKLYEETFSESEDIMPTESGWLRVANCRPFNTATMTTAISMVEASVEKGDAATSLTALRMIVPELTNGAEPSRQPQRNLDTAKIRDGHSAA